MKRLLVILASAMLFGGCSGSSSSPSTAPGTTTFAGAGFSATSEALKSVQSIVPATAHSLASNNVGALAAGSMNLIWDTNWIQDPRCSNGGGGHCGQTMGMKGYLALVMDPGALYDNGSYLSVFGRIDKALQTACAFSSVLYGANGELPAAGTQSITFDAATVAKVANCNFTAAELATLSGITLSVAVSATSDTSVYDRKFTMMMGNQSHVTLVRVTSSVVNVLATESEGTKASKTIVSLNRTSGLVRAEYISRDSSGAGEWHRIHNDPTASRANITGASYSTSIPFVRAWGLVGQPGAPSSQVAVTLLFKGDPALSSADAGASSASTYYHYKGCMTQSSGVMATADTLSCSGGITGVDLATNFETVTTNLITAITASGVPLVGANAAGETSQPPFTTGAQVFSAAVPVGP